MLDYNKHTSISSHVAWGWNKPRPINEFSKKETQIPNDFFDSLRKNTDFGTQAIKLLKTLKYI